MSYIVPIATLPKWFPDRPGFAAGIAVCGFGAGSGINVPIATSLISSTGGPLPTFGILGISYFVLVAGAALFMKNPPSEDYKLDGCEPSEQESKMTTERGWDFRGALMTWQWYALWAMLFLNTSAGLALISDAMTVASSIGGATSTLASTFVIMMGTADVAGRLFWPTSSDYIGPRNVFLTMFLLQAASFLLLPTLGYGAFVIFTVLSFVVLTCYRGGFGTMPPFASKYYGPREVGTIYGTMLTATGIATFGAPLLLATSTDATGSYNLALYLTAGLMLLSTIIPLVVRPPKPTWKAEVGAQKEIAE
jgi:MFS transporter, OFA family, oxalate/formate antiporter